MSSVFAIVSVVGSLCTGANYCCGAGTDFPLPMEVNGSPKAVFCAKAGVIQFPNASNFPIGPYGTGEWGQRCVFLCDDPTTANYTFSAENSGRLKMHMDAEQLLADDASGRVEVSAGFLEGRVYFAQSLAEAKMLLSMN